MCSICCIWLMSSHLRLKHQCIECGGSSICEHKRMRSRCKDCGGKGIACVVILTWNQEFASMFVCMCVYVCMHTCLYVLMDLNLYMCVRYVFMNIYALMYRFMYIRIERSIYMYIFTYIYNTFKCVCVYIHIYVYTCIHIHINMYTYIHICIRIYICICKHTCIYSGLHIHIYLSCQVYFGGGAWRKCLLATDVESTKIPLLAPRWKYHLSNWPLSRGRLIPRLVWFLFFSVSQFLLQVLSRHSNHDEHSERVGLKVGLGIFDFCTHSRRLISKNRFPHPISVEDTICGTRFDLRDSKRRALEN